MTSTNKLSRENAAYKAGAGGATYKLNIILIPEDGDIITYSKVGTYDEVDEHANLLCSQPRAPYWEAELLRNGYPWMFISSTHPTWATLEDGLAAYAIATQDTPTPPDGMALLPSFPKKLSGAAPPPGAEFSPRLYRNPKFAVKYSWWMKRLRSLRNGLIRLRAAFIKLFHAKDSRLPPEEL